MTKTNPLTPRGKQPKLLAYGTFNVYEIDGKAYIRDHIKKKFVRESTRDYLIGNKLSCQCGPFEFNNKKEYKEHVDNGIHELEMNSKIAMQWVEERNCP